MANPAGNMSGITGKQAPWMRARLCNSSLWKSSCDDSQDPTVAGDYRTGKMEKFSATRTRGA